MSIKVPLNFGDFGNPLLYMTEEFSSKLVLEIPQQREYVIVIVSFFICPELGTACYRSICSFPLPQCTGHIDMLIAMATKHSTDRGKYAPGLIGGNMPRY